MNLRRALLAWSIAGPALAFAEPVANVSPAAHDEAAKHLAAGRKFYAQGDYEAAERELLVGQELEPLPVFNYTLGQVERVLGRCNRAIDYYRAYLKVASASQRASTQVQINRCQEMLAEKGLTYRPGAEGSDGEGQPAVPAPVETPKVVAPAQVVVPSQVVSREPTPAPVGPVARPWYRDPLGMSLVGCGAGVVIAGGVLTGIGDPSNPRATYGAFEQARDRRWMEPTGIALLSVGGALLIGGAARLGIVSRRGYR